MVDGNRRWARQFNAPTSQGHQAGADKIHEFLGWCQELGVRVVTLYMLSTDNMNRSGEELDLLMGIIANTLDRLDEDANISVHAMGAPELLPDYLADRLTKLTARTPVREKLHVNVAVGYGGRREIVDAVRELLHDAVAHKGGHQRTRRLPERGRHLPLPLHPRPARSGPGDPDLRRAAALRFPDVAERLQRVLLLRGPVAGLPEGRLPSRPARLRRQAAALRYLGSGGRPPLGCRRTLHLEFTHRQQESPEEDFGN